MSNESEGFAKLKLSLEHSIKSHRVGPDAWYYNGGTVLVLSLTAGVSVLSGKVIPLPAEVAWLPSVLSAVAGVLVALERSLGFGPRWRFHTQMRAGYRTVNDMIDFYFIIPEDEVDQRKKIRAEIWQSLNALRNRESAIPNSGGLGHWMTSSNPSIERTLAGRALQAVISFDASGGEYPLGLLDRDDVR